MNYLCIEQNGVKYLIANLSRTFNHKNQKFWIKIIKKFFVHTNLLYISFFSVVKKSRYGKLTESFLKILLSDEKTTKEAA